MSAIAYTAKELHGHTVVVHTNGPDVYVGRCDRLDSEKITLVDVGEHRDGEDGRSKKAYLREAARFGVWRKHERKIVPRKVISSVQRLSELLTADPIEPSPLPEAPAEDAVSKPKPVDGKRILDLTPSAQQEVRRLLDEEGEPSHGLRLGIIGGGCSGLSYNLEFGPRKEGDLEVAYDGFKVYLDKKSSIYLRGTTLDHQKGLVGKGFVFKNPNATNTCGCGESFSV